MKDKNKLVTENLQNGGRKLDNKRERYEELVKKLNEASEAYYNGKEELISNYEWDAMFDEAAGLEALTLEVLS